MEGPAAAQVDAQEREGPLARWVFFGFAVLYLACLAWVGARFGQAADLIAGGAGLLLGGLLGGRRWARAVMLVVSALIVWAGIDLLYLTPAQGMPDRTLFELFWPAASLWLGFHAARRLRDFWTRKPRP